MARKLPDQEQYEFGFHDIPSPEEREKMSAEQLAIVLVAFDKRKPAQILVEHELQIRLIKLQTRSTRNAAIMGATAALVAAAFGAYLTAKIPAAKTEEHETKRIDSKEDSKNNISVQAPTVVQPEATRRPLQPASAPAPAIPAPNAASRINN